ncbi:MAG: hypothetical protein DRM99_05140, partial [Thermoplasmata archaeon]
MDISIYDIASEKKDFSPSSLVNNNACESVEKPTTDDTTTEDLSSKNTKRRKAPGVNIILTQRKKLVKDRERFEKKIKNKESKENNITVLSMTNQK